MNTLFEIDNEGRLSISPEAFLIKPFKKIWNRDRSKNKTQALKELAFVFFYCDVKSIYMITPIEDRAEEIKRDIELDEKWKVDNTIEEAIEFYNSRKSIVIKLYEASLKAANDMAKYLENTEELLKERDLNGKVVTDIAKISGSLKAVPIIMRDLKNAHKEVIKESHESEGKQKGSQRYNTFETGLSFE